MSRLTTYASGCVAVLAAIQLFLPAAALADASTANGLAWAQGPASGGVYPYCVNDSVGLQQHDSASGVFPAAGLYPITAVSINSSCTANSRGGYSGTAKVVPAGWLAIYRILYVWNGSNWATCTSDSDWVYNATQNVTLRLLSPGTQDGPVAAYPLTATGGFGPCGPGYYGLIAYTYAWTGTQWLGGSIWSDDLYTP